jgi:hypothetical protein
VRLGGKIPVGPLYLRAKASSRTILSGLKDDNGSLCQTIQECEVSMQVRSIRFRYWRIDNQKRALRSSKCFKRMLTSLSVALRDDSPSRAYRLSGSVMLADVILPSSIYLLGLCTCRRTVTKLLLELSRAHQMRSMTARPKR